MYTGSNCFSFLLTLLMTTMASAPTLRSFDNERILCKVSMVVETLPQLPNKTSFLCETIFPIVSTDKDWPPVVHFKPSSDTVKANQGALKNNEWYITFPFSWLSSDFPTPTINVPFDENVATVDPTSVEQLLRRRTGLRNFSRKPIRRRWMRETKPQESVLVVLVSARDADPGFTPSEARSIVFGSGTHGEVSAASQFSECSFGELQLVPYGNGVIEVQVGGAVSRYDKYKIRSEARSIVCARWNLAPDCNPAEEKGIDHIIYVLPFGLTSDTGSFGFGLGGVGGYYTTFQGPAFAPASILHEFGHNFFFGHAYENGVEYGDNTGQMGSSLHGDPDARGEKRCFNGYNMWEMGWLKDRRYHADPTIPIKIKLATFVDYNETSPDQFVYIRISDYYLTYNVAKGMNEHTREHEGKILVVQKVPDGEIDDYFDTELVAALDARDAPYTVKNYNSGNKPLVIEVCETIKGPPEYAILAIGLNADCDELTEAPTSEPTSSPSQRSTPAPTMSPTSHPTNFPTVSLTSVPTSPLSFAPTSSPTLIPSEPQSSAPSMSLIGQPTMKPSTAPNSQLPSIMRPNNGRTPDPTSAPTSGKNVIGSEKKQSDQCLGQTGHCESDGQCCVDQNLYCRIQNGKGTCEEKLSTAEEANPAVILGTLIPILALLPILLCCLWVRRSRRGRQITSRKIDHEVGGFRSLSVPGSPTPTADTTSSKSLASSPPITTASLNGSASTSGLFADDTKNQTGSGVLILHPSSEEAQDVENRESQ